MTATVNLSLSRYRNWNNWTALTSNGRINWWRIEILVRCGRISNDNKMNSKSNVMNRRNVWSDKWKLMPKGMWDAVKGKSMNGKETICTSRIGLIRIIDWFHFTVFGKNRVNIVQKHESNWPIGRAKQNEMRRKSQRKMLNRRNCSPIVVAHTIWTNANWHLPLKIRTIDLFWICTFTGESIAIAGSCMALNKCEIDADSLTRLYLMSMSKRIMSESLWRGKSSNWPSKRRSILRRQRREDHSPPVICS